MTFFDPQNPGIGGLDELTEAEALTIQNISGLGDPNADKILFWDDSAGGFRYLAPGTGLTITGTTIDASAGSISGSGTANEITYWVNSGTLGALAVATYPSLTELSYVKGVTSAIQTQLGTKQATITFGTGVQTALGVNVGSAGAVVLFNGALGTPTSGVATNLTGTAAGLTAGNVTTNANLTGVVTSTGNATAIADAALSIAKTSGLQAALDLKAPLASPTFTGVVAMAKLNVSVGNVDGITITSTGNGYLRLYTSSVDADARNWAIASQYNGNYFELLKSTTAGGDATGTVLAISKDGNMTIGGVSFSEKLYVVGNIGTSGNIELGHATDTTVSRLAAGTVGVEGIRVKTTTPLIVSAASYTTDTGTSLNMDNLDEFIITAQAGALLFNAPGGTLVQGRNLIIRIKDNATARALTWNAVFRAMGTALPTTTVLSKTLYLGFKYNSTDTKWDLIASAQEA